jgi:predicted RNA methylase
MDKRDLIKKLSKLNVHNVAFKNNRISLEFDGDKLSSKIMKKHIKEIGNWSRKYNRVYYNPDLKKEDILPILVHEVVEKYITEKYGLNVDKESHEIATAVEKNFIASKSWRSHEQRIAEDHIHKKKKTK